MFSARVIEEYKRTTKLRIRVSSRAPPESLKKTQELIEYRHLLLEILENSHNFQNHAVASMLNGKDCCTIARRFRAAIHLAQLSY